MDLQCAQPARLNWMDRNDWQKMLSKIILPQALKDFKSDHQLLELHSETPWHLMQLLKQCCYTCQMSDTHVRYLCILYQLKFLEYFYREAPYRAHCSSSDKRSQGSNPGMNKASQSWIQEWMQLAYHPEVCKGLLATAAACFSRKARSPRGLPDGTPNLSGGMQPHPGLVWKKMCCCKVQIPKANLSCLG